MYSKIFAEKVAGLKCIFAPILMATHSSTLAWKIPWIEEPGRLQSIMKITSEKNMKDIWYLFFLRLQNINDVTATLATSL